LNSLGKGLHFFALIYAKEDSVPTRVLTQFACTLVVSLQTGDRCYDLLNIFAEKFSEKIAVFAQTTASFCKNGDHYIGF
jgi:hypothetical protein